MPTGRIMMRPVDKTAFRVPLIFTEEFDRIAFPDGIDTGSKIDVVGDENSLTRGQLENEPLVSPSV
jgi:hypothetical protein